MKASTAATITTKSAGHAETVAALPSELRALLVKALASALVADYRARHASEPPEATHVGVASGKTP